MCKMVGTKYKKCNYSAYHAGEGVGGLCGGEAATQTPQFPGSLSSYELWMWSEERLQTAIKILFFGKASSAIAVILIQ